MADGGVLAAIAASSADNPVLLSVRPWLNGQGNEPPPAEMIVSVHVISGSLPAPVPAPVPSVPDVEMWAVGVTNVRKTASVSGLLLGQLGRGQAITLTGVLVVADGHSWRIISKGPIVGGYVAVDVLSTSAPP